MNSFADAGASGGSGRGVARALPSLRPAGAASRPPGAMDDDAAAPVAPRAPIPLSVSDAGGDLAAAVLAMLSPEGARGGGAARLLRGVHALPEGVALSSATVRGRALGARGR